MAMPHTIPNAVLAHSLLREIRQKRESLHGFRQLPGVGLLIVGALRLFLPITPGIPLILAGVALLSTTTP